MSSDLVERLRDEAGQLEHPLMHDAADEIERLREALYRIVQWADAYPEDMFPPLSDGEVKIAGAMLKVGGIKIGALHAGWARHLTGGIGDIARAALGEPKP